MKLNPDCVRDVMIALEEFLSFKEPMQGGYSFRGANIGFINRLPALADYDKKDIAYSVLQLIEYGYIVPSCKEYIKTSFAYFDPGEILYITPKGHDFIASVYDKEKWNTKLKPMLNTLGNISLSIIEAISKGVTGAAIDKLLRDAMPTA